MNLSLKIPEKPGAIPRIMVIGVGGAGGNAINNMLTNGLEGAEFIAANTDRQALNQSKAPTKIQLGAQLTEGLGAGMRPEVGAAAAQETLDELIAHLDGVHMCFITAGMGGGTGTGASPIIARAARERGALTIGVVTKPFAFEGRRRMALAEEGARNLQEQVDTLIVIPNQNLFSVAGEKTSYVDAFFMADDVLFQGVRGVTDLMVRPGLVNLDFADVCTVMDEMGKAMLGAGQAEGEDRALQAAEKAIANPLLEEGSLKGAHGVLVNVTCGPDLTLFEMDEAANRIREEVDADANIIIGSTLDPGLEGSLRISLIATGIAVDKETEEPDIRAQARHRDAIARFASEEPTILSRASVRARTPAGRQAAAPPRIAGSFATARHGMGEPGESAIRTKGASAAPALQDADAVQQEMVAGGAQAEEERIAPLLPELPDVPELLEAEPPLRAFGRAADDTPPDTPPPLFATEEKEALGIRMGKGRRFLRKMTGGAGGSASRPSRESAADCAPSSGEEGAHRSESGRSAGAEEREERAIPAFLRGRQAS